MGPRRTSRAPERAISSPSHQPYQQPSAAKRPKKYTPPQRIHNLGEVTAEQAVAITSLTPTTSFLGLPFEVRQRIHRLVLEFTDGTVAVKRPYKGRIRRRNRHWNGNGLAILGVNHAIRSEITQTFAPDSPYDTISHLMLPRMTDYPISERGRKLRRWLPHVVRQNIITVLLHADDFTALLFCCKDPTLREEGSGLDVSDLFTSPGANFFDGLVQVWFPSYDAMHATMRSRLPKFDRHFAGPLANQAAEFESVVNYSPGPYGWNIIHGLAGYLTYHGCLGVTTAPRSQVNYILVRCVDREEVQLGFVYCIGWEMVQEMVFNKPEAGRVSIRSYPLAESPIGAQRYTPKLV
jgi:hypothetical protein